MRTFWLLALAVHTLLQGPLFAQSITGRVSDARTGAPLPSANVLLQPGNRGVATDETGRFSLPQLQPGEYTLRVSHVGYRSDVRTVSLGNETLTLAIDLQPSPTQGPLIEISASRATERFSPVTFSNIGRETLEREYFVQDVPVLLSDLPSVTYYSEGGSGIGYNYLRIRGFDQRRLAVMVNGVPQNDPEDHNVYWINLVDMLGNTEDIQIQRGAGSAFYGPPAIGGSINIVTGDFADRKGVTLSTGGGSYNTQRYAIAAGSGLVDDTYTLYARLSRMSTDGYRDHSWVKASSYYLAATRYDTDVTTRVNVYGGPLEDGLVYTGLPKFAIKDRDARRKNYNYWEAENGAYTYTQDRRKQEHEQFSQPHYELLNEWRASDVLTFNSALFYVVGQGYFDYDGTGWTDAAYYRLTPEFGFPNAPDPGNPIIRAYVDNRQFGWLPRLTLKHGGGAFTAGFELRRHRSVHWGRIQSAAGLPEELDPSRHYYEYKGGKDVAAVFAQEQLQLSERVNVQGSVQYVFNRYRLFDEMYVGTDFSSDYHFLNPRLGINYNIDERWNLYGSVSLTSREPRLKNLYDAAESSGGETPQFAQRPDGSYDFTSPVVKPEQLLNSEFGAGYIADGVRVLVNTYVMDFSDEIVKSGQLDRFGQPITGNAEKTLHLGLELSAQLRLLRTLTLDVNGLFSRSRLSRYSVFEDDGSGGVLERKLDGNHIAGFPEQLANAKLTWRDRGLSVVALWKYVGKQYTDNEQNEDNSVDAWNVFNLAVGYRSTALPWWKAVELRLAVNNVFDALYAQSGEGDQFFVGAERNYFIDLAFEL
ncbi:MAG: TonB-dependent receptor [Bacteroidia bacterium]|nr:TonB-dependent receptor [Bacteroidia bacterium]